MVIHRELKCRPWEIPPFWPEPGDGNNKWARLAYARYLALERAIKATRRQPAPHDLLSRREGTR